MAENPRNAPYPQNECGDPRIFYVFNIILSFSTCTWEILGANVLKPTYRHIVCPRGDIPPGSHTDACLRSLCKIGSSCSHCHLSMILRLFNHQKKISFNMLPDPFYVLRFSGEFYFYSTGNYTLLSQRGSAPVAI